MTPAELVREFHETYGLVVRDELQRNGIPAAEVQLRRRLLREEYDELMIELRPGSSKVEAIARELADLIYVIYGAALHYGVDLDAVVEEVHRANMDKRDIYGVIRRRADGKVLKPAGWRPPDAAKVLGL